MPTYAETLNAGGWRSGSVLPLNLHELVRPHLRHGQEPPLERIDAEDWLIVISQTCDLLAHNDIAEPHVELLLAHPIQGQPRTQYRDLNSTRCIDFRPNRLLLPDKVLTGHATKDRYLVPRELLLTANPHVERILSSAAIKKLQNWLSLRASRPAWPDAFVERLNTVRHELKAALTPLSDEISEVRISIGPKDRELPANEKYRIAIYFVVAGEHFDLLAVRTQVIECFHNFVRTIRRCAGIEIDDDLSEVVSGDVFTWAEVESSDLWNFAFLSQNDD